MAVFQQLPSSDLSAVARQREDGKGDGREEQCSFERACRSPRGDGRGHRIDAGAGHRLFFLDIRGGRVVSTAPDGSDVKVLVSGRYRDARRRRGRTEGGHIYWTNMGRPREDDGRIERVDLDGGNLTTIVPAGGTFTPKQLKLDAEHRKLYWSDREGMRIMRANLDGSNIETLVETARGDAARRDARNWCVGIALDVPAGRSTGRRRAETMPDSGASAARASRFPKARTRHTARTSRCCSMDCPSRSTWISICTSA